MDRTEDNIRYWREKVSKNPDAHFATAGTTLNPEKVDVDLVGHHLSIPLVRGTRVYMFDNQANRDRFVNYYRPHGARPCPNPHP